MADIGTKRRRVVGAMLAALALLPGCAASRLPSMPRLPEVSLPRLDLFGPDEADLATTRYKLNDAERERVRADFSAAFTDGRTLIFGPIGARQRADGPLIVCGLVSVRNLDGRETGMKLFDGRGTLDPATGSLRFEPNRLAGANGKFIEIYGRCRDHGIV